MKLHAINNRQDGTQERILDAAEKLFMKRGFVTTSMRMITAQAQVNLSAVNYHFGSKEELIKEIFARRLGPLNRERIAHLDDLEKNAAGKPLRVEKILEAYVASALHMGGNPLQGGAVFLRLLGRAFSEPPETIKTFLPQQYRAVVQRFKTAFARALPHLPEQELVWRMHFMFGAVAYTLAGNDALQLICNYVLDDAQSAQAITRHLLPFLVAGLNAPLPHLRVVRKTERLRSHA
ncbi:MAG: TetR/AcrR family transcriptional regulator [Burkholderiales bacterium]